MRKALIALAAGGALTAAAAPALAQYYDDGYGPQQRETQLSVRIDRGLDNGTLRPEQAARLRMELREIVDLDRRYQYDGMSSGRMQDLSSRLSLLDSRLNYDVTMNTGDW